MISNDQEDLKQNKISQIIKFLSNGLSYNSVLIQSIKKYAIIATLTSCFWVF